MIWAKANIMYGEMTKNDKEKESIINFLASTGWLRKIM